MKRQSEKARKERKERRTKRDAGEEESMVEKEKQRTLGKD
jgi:hypothetical protein